MLERIKELLQVRQLGTTQFADAIGVARPVVSHMLSGRNKPSLDVVQRILAAFPDLSMAWLLKGTGPMLAGGATPAPEVRAASSPPSGTATAETAGVSAPPPPFSPPATAPTPAGAPAVSANSFNSFADNELNVSKSSTFSSASPNSQSQPATERVKKAALPQPARRFDAAPRSVPAVPAVLFAEPSAAPVPAAAPAHLVAPADAQGPALPAAAAPAEIVPAAPANVPAASALALPPVPGKAIRRIVLFYHDGSFADFAPE